MYLADDTQVRATSHKPDEIYGIIERLSPGTRKIELFGRPHNVQPNWWVHWYRLMPDFIACSDFFKNYSHLFIQLQLASATLAYLLLIL